MKAKLHYVFSIAMFLLAFSVFGQNTSWKKIEGIKTLNKINSFQLDKNKVKYFELNPTSFNQKLAHAPLRNTNSKQEQTVISIPGQNGALESFIVFEAPVFSPELAAKYPDIKSFIGYGLANTDARLRMSVSPLGIKTMISYTDKPTVFMEPLSKNSHQYFLYNKDSKYENDNTMACQTIETIKKSFGKSSEVKINEGGANTKTLQKFRIAVSVTGEYTRYFGGTVANALAGINASLNRVNEVFETDMAVTFELVNATQLIYTDATTDPYSDADIGTDEANANDPKGWNGQIQTTLNNTIGDAAYDVGHLFGATGGGGNAGCIGCVCVDGSKGSAYSSPADAIPEGDTFDLNFVAHEIGHQMGASHTFAYEIEGSSMQAEPGSGSTIMAYAGIADENDIQIHSDAYFHYNSIKQILTNLKTKSCQSTSAISNNPPVADAGNNYTIPVGTPYILKGNATDNNVGDNLTYCWEQIDSGLVNSSNFSSDLTAGSTNRSLPPKSSPNRYIPNIKSVLNGKLTESNPTVGSFWESISTVPRTLNWALTVRDRNPLTVIQNGQTSYDTMRITVDDNSGPFMVTSQNIEDLNVIPGSTETVRWDVANTNNGAVNVSNVNILLSTDGGLSFPTTLLANTPNDGSQNITVPDMSAPYCRIMVEAVNNIFYAINEKNFSINYSVVTTCNPSYKSGQNLGLPINDTKPTVHTINVPNAGTISDVKVGVNISHTYLDDLIVQITHPNGTTSSKIWNRNCSSENDIVITFEDWATNISCNNTADGNTHAPAELLDVFNGLEAAGSWKISITDIGIGDNGTLNDWSLDICTQSTSLSNTEVEEVISGIKVYPNPNNGNFWVLFNPNSSEDINIMLFDIRGRQVLNNTYTNSSGVFKEELKLNNIQSGMYMLSITNGPIATNKKIIIK